MIFPSFTFLFFFLPLVLLGYLVCPKKLRNVLLLTASLFFYAWGAPQFVALLVVSSLVDYGLSLLITRSSEKQRQLLLFVSIVLNVGLLGYYKYANFFMAQVQVAGIYHGIWKTVILPIGISFFTFHKISYVVDVYRDVSKPSRNVIDYLLYITFFPQLIAGPIVRYHEIETYLTNRHSNVDDWYTGITRFCFGLGKKVILADPAGAIANNIFGLQATSLATPYCWLGAVAYSVQLYFDFSGYSDMAIGLARIFGFKFPENFNEPYIAKNFTDFWRRWHMSLSRWMRDYLYIPLGGSRHGTFKTYRNLWIVFLLSGLWHGANWTFVAWGAFHGLFLVLDRVGWEKISLTLPACVSIALTYVLVLVSWVLFRSPTFDTAATYLKVMFMPFKFWEGKIYIPPALLISNQGEVMLLIGLGIIFILPLLRPLFAKIPAGVSQYAVSACSLIFLALACMALASGHFSPFIYFQF